MEKLIILQGLTVEELLKNVETIVQVKLEEHLQKHSSKTSVRYLSTKEVCEILQISKPTLYDWTKQGLINSYRISTRVYYKSDEIDASLKKRKYLR